MTPLANRVAVGVARAAVLIAAVTMLARVVGFGRWLVFSAAVEDSCLATAYVTANMLPNILFEVVAGGALAGAVVPLVAGALARGEQERARGIASALLGWTLLAVVPLSVLAVVLAGPVMSLLVPDAGACSREEVVAVAARMFVVLAPQIALYGVAVVFSGLLNAHGRFLAPALGPLVSSVVMVLVYTAFGVGYDGDPDELGALPRRWELLLAGGTTLGVLALALTTALPLLRRGMGLRPALRFPAGAGPLARSLALAGLAGVVAQQLATVVVILLANGYGAQGALAVWVFAWAVFVLPYGVLAVPLATSAFTALSAQVHDEGRVAATSARSTRAIVLAGLLGAALVAGTAWPTARMFLPHNPAPLAWALVAFAPGLVGYSVLALHGRALYALGRGRVVAVATVAGWATVVVAQVALVPLVGPGRVVAALGAGTSAGLTLAGLLAAASLTRRLGPAALTGTRRAAAVGAAAAVAGGVPAFLLGASVGDGWGRVGSALLAALCGLLGAAAFALVLLALDREDVRTAVATLRRRPQPEPVEEGTPRG